uniref:Secreted protein n=1 Tax=Trichogramma kaykai TaxID=54128 RepID=A0ABD2XIU6_9HYME
MSRASTKKTSAAVEAIRCSRALAHTHSHATAQERRERKRETKTSERSIVVSRRVGASSRPLRAEPRKTKRAVYTCI